MKERDEEKKEKKDYKKPLLTRHGKLTSLTARETVM